MTKLAKVQETLDRMVEQSPPRKVHTIHESDLLRERGVKQWLNQLARFE
jgi:hypothetical protein